MRLATAARELVTLDGSGILMRGTYHRPAVHEPSHNLFPGKNNRLGILLLNAFLSPRAAFGDTAVEWAQSFADLGYPAFRFDLPGLGDSGGETPHDLLGFINKGGYAAITVAKSRELMERYKLSGIVLLGHCAGAVTAAFAAAEMPECRGVIIMDPYFHLTRTGRSQASSKVKLRSSIADWSRRYGVGPLLVGLRDQTRAVKRSLMKNALPRNANRALLSAWQRVLSSGVPTLVLRARDSDVLGDASRPGSFDYLRYLADSGGRMAVNVIDDTDHCFAEDEGRAAVKRFSEAWLSEHFPMNSNAESLPKVPVYSWTASREGMSEALSCDPSFKRV